MGISSKLEEKQHRVLGICIDGHKEISSSGSMKVLRKASLVWRFFTFVLVAACGIYMCLIGVDRKLDYEKLSLDPALQQTWTKEHICSRSSRLDFAQHFPNPRTYSRSECSCSPVHFFVILSMQRSGSGWFETLLNSHPNVSSHGEIFSVRERRANFTTMKQTLDQVYNLDWWSSAAKNECTAAVGFKWMVNQGVWEYRQEVSEYLRRRGVSVILLLRRNSLKRLISILSNAYDRAKPLNNSTHVAHVHSAAEAELLASYKPTVDVANLLPTLRQVQQTHEAMLRLFNVSRMVAFYYEDIVKDPKKVDAIQPFLGVPKRKLESKHVKIHTRPLAQLITNWEDVYRVLNGTEFETFLQDRDYA